MRDGLLALTFALITAATASGQGTPDPCLVTKYTATRDGNYTNGHGSAEWWIPDDPAWDNETAPIIVIRHGNGMNFRDYSFLLEHLALNGFIAASVEGVAPDLLGHIQTLKGFFGAGDVPVGLLGHSVGGKTVVETALLNENQGKPHDLQALLALAPAPGVDLPLPATACDSLFVIYGSKDEDVTGWQTAAPPAPFHPPTNGFSLYDQAGTEANMDDMIIFPWNPPMRRNMLFVHGADHNRFREPAFPVVSCPTDAYLTVSTHQNLLKGYATAYYLWQLQGEWDWEDVIEGRDVPGTILSDATSEADDWGQPAGAPIRLSFQHSQTRRRVIANFEQPAAPLTSPIVSAVQDEAHDFTWFSPHDTRVLDVTCYPIPDIGWQWVLFGVPDQFDPWTGNKQNVEGFEAFSFRAGQVYVPEDDIYNPNPYLQDQDFLVVLIDEDLGFQFASADTWGSLPYPDKYIYEEGGVWPCKSAADYTKTAMSTVSIPLSVFAPAVDLTRVIAVGMVFPEGTGGKFHFDNIEFTN